MSDAPVIRARGLEKRFAGAMAVDGIDFEVPAAQCFGLLGPNGAGKTTTLRMILGLSPMDGGRLEVLGQAMPQGARSVRACMGVVAQNDNLDPDFSVRENLLSYARFFRLPGDGLNQRIEQLLDFVDLGHKADSATQTLSGGMKRRLAFVRALINEPELIVLDEPTTGLDPQVRHLLWGRIRQLVGQGRTVLLTTHYLEEAERLCDQLIILDQGRILDQGSPRELITRHVEPEVVEITLCNGVRSDRLQALHGRDDCRLETIGDVHYCYTHDGRATIAALDDTPDMTYLHRPANLEDVFLKLTGRDLRG